MTYEEIPPSLIDWLFNGMIVTLIRVAMVVLFGFLVSFLVASARRGPVEGFYVVAKVVASGVVDLANWSFRRTIAMSMLAVQEAVRRRVIIAFAVFLVLVLFGGWYLDVKSDHPARLYLSFVLTSSNYLVVMLALFLSAFSLPTDIKNRTIYTIVTKPVRAIEIVLGRIIGFVAVGTVLLAAMAIVSYFFVVRGLSHEHAVEVASNATSVSAGVVAEGETTYDAHHRHTFKMYSDGTGETDIVMNHWHQVTQVGETYELGPPIGLLQARVPVYGELSFKDRAGADAAHGVNVGHEWAYRSYIEGGTLAAAIWTFNGVNENRYPEGLDIELNLRVFRTYKGDIEKGILGSIELQNPNANAKYRRSEPISFTATEFRTDRRHIPRKLRLIDSVDGSVVDGDLFDLVENGQIQVIVKCAERAQYYGMAERDVYILDADGVFALNFVKGYVGIWLQMVIVTAFGVMFSTFLSGAVAMMATLSSIIIGFFTKFIVDVATGALMGGGPIESLVRIVTQMNLQQDLEAGTATEKVIRGIDTVLMLGMRSTAGMLPDFRNFSTVQYVAYGYNIDAAVLSTQLLSAISYVAVVSLVAYFFLKTREVAA